MSGNMDASGSSTAPLGGLPEATPYGGGASLHHETTASGRGRVQALPFQREQRLQENGERCCTRGAGTRETDNTGDSGETVSAAGI